MSDVKFFRDLPAQQPADPHADDWAEVTRDHRGVPEVTVRWVANHTEEVRIVDVREPDELVGPLGAIDGAENVPLRQLTETAVDWRRDNALVLFCRSGGRSGRGAQALEQMGFTRVVSMAGGMIEWNTRHLPTV